MLNKGHITTWLLLLTAFLHRKKIVLWGHGISVRRYSSEEKKLPLTLRWMIRLADGVWFYTDQEQQLWKKQLPSLKSVSLNNTISDVDQIVRQPVPDQQAIRQRHGIKQTILFIFCARFNDPARRTDLLLQAIQQLDPARFGFIIVGEGKLKPDFALYDNVYDFGEVYDRKTKDELFGAADIYFQPAWIGLSVVEAMAYGKPVFTLKRSGIISQGVEYGYISNGVNGMLFDDINALIKTVPELTREEIGALGLNAKAFARERLSMQNMVNSGLTLLQTIS
jgi:glycosyltransferase involved in cell wall biosynthesis